MTTTLTVEMIRDALGSKANRVVEIESSCPYGSPVAVVEMNDGSQFTIEIQAVPDFEQYDLTSTAAAAAEQALAHAADQQHDAMRERTISKEIA